MCEDEYSDSTPQKSYCHLHLETYIWNKKRNGSHLHCLGDPQGDRHRKFGYLLAGIVIGPFGMSLIGDIEAVIHFTEFGVVMMLFLVGFELRPPLLWQIRMPIFGMGGTQVVLTSLMAEAVTVFFLP